MLVLLLTLAPALCWATTSAPTASSAPHRLSPSIRAGPDCGLSPNAINVNVDQQNLQSFPGFGWDNLQNLPMAAVFDVYSYLQCRLSPDRRHLVPDFTDVIPVKQSSVDRFAEFYSDFRSYFYSTTNDINFSSGARYKGIGISGSYSKHYQLTKRMTLQTSTSIMRTTIKTHGYSLISQPDAPLEPDFKARILQIGDALRMNKTFMAQYLAQVMIRDYGTHVITRVEAGSIVAQEDYVDKTKMDSEMSSEEEARSAAAASFFKVCNFKFDSGRSTNTSIAEKYEKITKHSTLIAQGGPDINAIVNQNSWANASITDLVALDRAGDPLFWYINPLTIPELPEPMVNVIQELIRDATQLYYDQNTIPGCTNPASPNFKYQANLDDGSCGQPYSNYSFGGVFQKCTQIGEDSGRCDNLTINNGDQGGLFCPDGFAPQPLIDTTYTFPPRPYQTCSTATHRCKGRLFKKCHETVCNQGYKSDVIHYQTFWCKADRTLPPNTGYMFGGAYTDRRTNPFTQSQSCPGRFFSVTLGAGTDEFSLCLSRDYELDTEFSVPFGGFVTCENQGADEKQCPSGYSQHLMTRIDQCEIYYCIRTGDMKLPGDSSLERPPFMPVPTDVVSLVAIHAYPDGRLWTWNETTSAWDANQDVGMTGPEAMNIWIQYENSTVDQ